MSRAKPVVFLSYSRADAAAVDALHRKLEQKGFDAWMDRSDITAGDWRTAIKRGLRRSNFFLACLSRRTESLSEVMEFEVDSALEVQQESLEGEVYLIPVRLEPCETPEKLRHLQWIDLFAPGGEKRLLAVLRSKTGDGLRLVKRWVALGALALAIIPGMWWWRNRERYPDAFVESRPGGRLQDRENRFAMAGVTIWRLREPAPQDPPLVRLLMHPPDRSSETILYTPTRARTDNLRARDRIVISIESSRNGYLYVIDRAVAPDGTRGRPRLILPTRQINGGDHEVARARPLQVPDRYSWPSYLEVPETPSVSGILITVVISPSTLPGVSLEHAPSPIREELVTRWEMQFGAGVAPVFQDQREVFAAEGEVKAMGAGGLLGPADPPPELIFAAKRKASEPLAIKVEMMKAR